MGADSGRGLSGILIHNDKLSYVNRDTTNIVATQANPQPGDPIAATSDTLLRPKVQGGQDTDLDVYVSRTGMPGITVGNCRVITKASAATDWNGYTTADVCFDTQWLDSSTATHPLFDSTRIPSSGKVVLVQAHEAAAVGTDVSAHIWDPSDNSWTTVLIIDSDGGASQHWRDLAITTLPDESLVVMIHANTAPNNEFTMWRSKDAGATWAIYNTDALPVGAGVGTTNGGSRSQMAYSSPDVLWLRQHVGGTDTDILQYASTSQGAEFTEVRQWTTSTSAYPAEINLLALPDGSFAMIYLSASTVISMRRIGNAWEAFEDATATTVSSGGTRIGVSAHIDEDGIIHVYYSVAAGLRHLQSNDMGETWETYTQVLTTASGDEPNKMISVSSMGIHFMVCNANAGTGANDPDVQVFMLGGWGPGELRVDRSGITTAATPIFANYELPYDMATSPFTRSGSAGAWTLDNDGGTILTCSADQDYLDWVPANGKVDVVCAGAIEIASGGSTSLDMVRLQSGDGVSDLLQTSLRFDRTTNVVKWIGNSSTGILDIAHTWSTAGKCVFKIWIDAANDRCFLAYRAGNTIEWTLADGGDADKAFDLTSLVSSIDTTLTFGARVAMTVTAHFFALQFWESDAAGGFHAKAAQTDLHGKEIGPWAYPLPGIGPDTEVARLTLAGGPGRLTDSFDIDAASSHPLSNLYPIDSPSPQAPWRATGTTEEIPLAWDNTYNTKWGNSIAIAVFNCNFPTAVLEGATGGGGWSTIATLDMDVGFDALTFDRSGDMITVDNAGSTNDGGRYIWRNEFAGATVDLGGGNYRKVRKNSAGNWLLGGTTGVKPIFWVDGIDGGEDTAGGTMKIWARHACAIVHNVSDYDQFRLRIPTGSNVDGYWQIGAVVIGEIAVVGKQHDWGWKWRVEPNAISNENASGTSFAKKKGNPKRTLTASWNSGSDLSGIRRNSTTALDYLIADAGNPLSVVDDVGMFLASIVGEINSGQTPIVVLPSIPKANTVLTDPWDFLYARPVGAVQLDHVLGDERSNEVYRTPPWSFSEII